MKKKIIGIALFAIIAVGAAINMNQDKDLIITDLALNNVEALASGEINPNCPNGCVSGSGGCNCNGYYSQYREYSGW